LPRQFQPIQIQSNPGAQSSMHLQWKILTATGEGNFCKSKWFFSNSAINSICK
jgi:hypothetical protein